MQALTHQTASIKTAEVQKKCFLIDAEWLVLGRLVLGRAGLELPMTKASLAVFDAGNDPSLEPATLKMYLPPRVIETLS